MKRILYLLLCVMFLCSCYRLGDQAQRWQGDSLAGTPESGNVEEITLPLPPDEVAEIAKIYRLGNNDRLTIADQSVPGTRREHITIDANGCISYLNLINIPAVGKTLDEFAADLTARLRERHREPFVTVSIEPGGNRGYFVYIFGQVPIAGSVPFDRPLRVLDVIAKAGGIELDLRGAEARQTVDLKHSFISRHGEILHVDFQALIERGELRHNIQLHPGDVVFLSSLLDQEITVLGSVGNPGAQELVNGLTLVGALARAGGVTEQAYRRSICVLRGNMAKPDLTIVDIDAVLAGKIRDFSLTGGDLVYVPERPYQYPKELAVTAIKAFFVVLGARAGSDAFDRIAP